MPTALLPLFFVPNTGKLVYGETSPEPFSIPDLYQEDQLRISLVALNRISQISPFFERINLNGYSLTISVGTAGTVRAQQATFTLDATGALVGSLDLNTAAITALADGASQKFEIILTNGATTKHRAQWPVTIRKSVSISGALVSPPADTALGRLEALRTYVLKEGASGDGVILTSPDGSKKGYLYWGDDNALHAEPIS